MGTIQSFILNTKKFLKFFYKKKITSHDVTLKSNPATLEDFKDISNVIIQDNQKLVQNM
jgi:hypothetical protein